eukprot:5120699-Amphidinium_carterae.1
MLFGVVLFSLKQLDCLQSTREVVAQWIYISSRPHLRPPNDRLPMHSVMLQGFGVLHCKGSSTFTKALLMGVVLQRGLLLSLSLESTGVSFYVWGTSKQIDYVEALRGLKALLMRLSLYRWPLLVKGF